MGHDFEVNYGSEETFREMLRIRRSVEVRYTQTAYTEQFEKAALEHQGGDSKMSELQKMEQEALQKQKVEEMKVDFVAEKSLAVDPNEIDLEQQAVPTAVYMPKAKKGALDRF